MAVELNPFLFSSVVELLHGNKMVVGAIVALLLPVLLLLLLMLLLLILLLLVVLSLLGAVPWVATLIILGRELGITLYRLVVIKKQVLGASGWGKFKTVMQIVAICMVIAPFGFLGAWFGWLTQIVLWFTVALTVYTGVQYLVPKK